MALFMKRANNEFCYCWSACGLVHTQVYVIDWVDHFAAI